MAKICRITLIFSLLLIALNSNAQGFGSNPDYYELSHSYRKMITSWDLSNPEFIEIINQADDYYTTKVVNGAIELVALTDGLDWGVDLSKLDSLCDWEIETRVKMDSKSFQDFLIMFSGRNDSLFNIVALLQHKRVISAQTHLGEEIKNNDVNMYEWLQGEAPIVFTIRKQKSRMMLFVNYRFAVTFPPEFSNIPTHRFNWILPEKNQKLYIYSFNVYRISDSYEKEFIESHPAAQLASYESLKKQVTLDDELNDNRNNWTDQDCNYNFSPTVKFSRGCIKIKEKPVRIDNAINPNGNFEVTAIVRRTKHAGRLVIGVDSCSFFNGFECALWANRSYSTFNPFYYVWFGVDNYQHYERYYTPKDDQIKYTIRKVDDIYYVFVDDTFTTAITNFPKIGTGISFVYSTRGEDGMLDYIRVTELK